jgi:hypothetical protein
MLVRLGWLFRILYNNIGKGYTVLYKILKSQPNRTNIEDYILTLKPNKWKDLLKKGSNFIAKEAKLWLDNQNGNANV